jgi:predicted PurR-regulated permease PerM
MVKTQDHNSKVPPVSHFSTREETDEGPNTQPVVVVMPFHTNAILLCILTVALLYLLRYAQDLFVPVAISVLIAYALDPLVTVIQRLKVPRAIAAALVILGLVGLAGYGSYGLRYQALAVIHNLPEAAAKVRAKIQEVRRSPGDPNDALGSIQKVAKEIERTATDGSDKSSAQGVTKVQIQEPAFRASDYLWAGSLSVIALIAQAVLILFLVFFLLSSGDFFKRKLVRLIGTKLSEKRITVEALSEIAIQIERFLLVQAFTSVLVGFLTALALWAYGLNHPIVWGLAAAVLNSVPYFGAIIETVGLTLVAFLQFDSVSTAGQIAGVALLIHGLSSMLLNPLLMGRASRINGVAMFLSLLFWSWLWGVIGMILAVPITMVIKSVCDRVEGLQAIGNLLDET